MPKYEVLNPYTGETIKRTNSKFVAKMVARINGGDWDTAMEVGDGREELL